MNLDYSIQIKLHTIILLWPSIPLQDIKAVVDGIDGIKLSQGLALGLGDFDLIRVIGRGSYAKVLLVRLKKNEQVYAMKVVKKELVHDDEVRLWDVTKRQGMTGANTVIGSCINESSSLLVAKIRFYFFSMFFCSNYIITVDRLVAVFSLKTVM